MKGSTGQKHQRKDKAMAETVSHASTIQDDHRAVPTVPEDVASPDGIRSHPDGLLTSSTVHNRTDNPLRSPGMDGLQDTNKSMSTQNETVMAGSSSTRERRGSTATTATMMSNATSLAGKSVECPGCKKLIDQASGGVVVAFGYVMSCLSSERS